MRTVVKGCAMLTKVVGEGFHWMAAAADDPQEAEKVWLESPKRAQSLPTGRVFDVVIVGTRLGMDTWDLLRRYRLPSGPIALHRKSADVAFFLKYPRGRALFELLAGRYGPSGLEYRYLSDGDEFPVPGPELDTEGQWEWLEAPGYWPNWQETDDAATAALAVMLAASAWAVSRADDWGGHTGREWDESTTPERLAQRVSKYLRVRAQLFKGIA